MSRETYKIVSHDGEHEFIGATSSNQAHIAAEQIFPGKVALVELASEAEIRDLFRSHSFDGVEADDFTGD